MSQLVKISGLTKSYLNKKALRGIDLEIEKGKIVGLLGPNGSGKTTLMKIAAGLIKPSSGEILIEGYAPGIHTKSKVSYLPDVNFLYKWMRISDAIDFYQDFFEDFDAKKCSEMLEFMKLDPTAKVTSLSKGMLEKLNLTLVLSRKAKLYILDEPLGGIDPVSREKIIDAIISNYTEESTFLISTHLVKDVERLFDEVAFISEGQVLLKGNAEQLRMERGKSMDELYREVYG